MLLGRCGEKGRSGRGLVGLWLVRSAGWVLVGVWSTVSPSYGFSSSVCKCLWFGFIVLVCVCSSYAFGCFLVFLGDPLHFVPRRAIRYISPRGGEDTASIPIA